MNELTEIERRTEQALVEERGHAEGKAKFAEYVVARECLMKEVLPEIKGVDWTLTDHGPDHVIDVLKNASALIPNESAGFSGTELYCLILSILFHDVGNVFGDRKTHQRNITAAYEFVRQAADRVRQEQWIIEKTAAAHCGTAPNGSRDTLAFVEESTQLDRRPVRLRQVAAVLRLADELAEGPQRTSLFMQNRGKYPRGSQIYHEYARAANICIGHANERIAITIHREIKSNHGKLTKKAAKSMKEFLEFAYKRILKLEQERRYARYYCDLLTPFKRTTVAFNFWVDGRIAELGLELASLSDLVVPGDSQASLVELHLELAPDAIVAAIEKVLKERAAC